MVFLKRNQTRRSGAALLEPAINPKKANPGLARKRQPARPERRVERSFGAEIEKEDNNHAMIIYSHLL